MSDSFIVEDQRAAAALLADPATHAGERPAVIDTHGAMVFVLTERVYKVKRAVKFAYMDFSTLEKRLATLQEELRVNRRTAPEIYVGIAPIVRAGDALRLGEVGEESPAAIEYALVMRRFEATFDEIADRGALTAGQIAIVAEQVAELHRTAEIARRDDPVARVRSAAAGAIAQARQSQAVLPEAMIGRVEAALLTLVTAAAPQIAARSSAGLERHCHGDLHLRNICLFEGKPALFDAIDFNPNFARIDVLYDLAFLLMDLEVRGLRVFANLAMNTYLDRRTAAGWPDEAGLRLLPLFLALRAAIRAEVSAHMVDVQKDPAKADALRREAKHHLEQAARFARPAPPRLIAVAGLSGSGKSTLAGALTPLVGRPPGARWLRSDVMRKALAGVGPLEKLPAEAYTADHSAKVYAYLLSAAATALAAGQSVVLDAVHARPAERFAVEALAARAGVPFQGIWLDAPTETRAARVGSRTGDPSDAGATVAEAQAAYELGPINWQRFDATPGPDAVLAAVRQALGFTPQA